MDGHKRDRQTNVLISKSGKHFGALWTMEGRAGLSGLEWVWWVCYNHATMQQARVGAGKKQHWQR
jgi:hypothetical protein